MVETNVNERERYIKAEDGTNQKEFEVKLYKRRWFILILYVVFMVCNSAQWLQYSIISNIVTVYYNVTSYEVELTTLIVMVCYLPLAFPFSYLMDKMTLRISALIGIVGTAVGSWIKVASVSREKFYITFIGQTIIAITQIFMVSMPPKLSSLWFGQQEVSLACNIAMFGQQLGFGMGFLISPLMVRNNKDLEVVGHDLKIMFLSVAIFVSIVCFFVIILFAAEPPKPPSLSQATLRLGGINKGGATYFKILKKLFWNWNYLMLFFTTGVNNGCFNSVSTLMNQIVIAYFPGREQDVGTVGVIMVIGGMTSSMVFGAILDKTKRFKELIIFIYYMGSVGMALFAMALCSHNILIVYCAAFFLGSFLSGFTPVSFDVATEVTYPESEVIVATIMNMGSLLFTIVMTTFFGTIIRAYGSFWGNFACVGVLFLGASMMVPIKMKLRRHEANTSAALKSKEEKLLNGN